MERKNYFVFYFLFFIFVAVDQITKGIFSSRDFLIDAIIIQKNSALLFGIDFGPTGNWLILVFAFMFFGVYFFRHWRDGNQKIILSLVLILSGAAANGLDRLFYGFVRDFAFENFPIAFNLADIYILLGLLLVLVYNKPKSQDKLI